MPSPLSLLGMYDFFIDNIRCNRTYIVHPPHPFHLIFSLELFCNSLPLCHLCYKLRKHILGLPVNISEVGV